MGGYWARCGHRDPLGGNWTRGYWDAWGTGTHVGVPQTWEYRDTGGAPAHTWEYRDTGGSRGARRAGGAGTAARRNAAAARRLPAGRAAAARAGRGGGAGLPAGRGGAGRARRDGGGARVAAAGAAAADGGRRRPADAVPLLALLQRAAAVRRARRRPPETRHPHPLPVRGHGGGRALRQLHVLRRQAPLVRPGRRPAARRRHLRRPRRRPRALRRLAQGADVLPDHRHHRRLPHPGERRRRALPPEAAQPLPAVHGAGLPGHLPHLPGLLAAAQQGGPPGLPEPHPGRRAHPPAALRPLRAARLGLPLGLLRARGGAGPRRAAAPRHPAHRRQHRLLARRAPRRVLEPDEAHRAERGHLRGRRHPGHGRLSGRARGPGLPRGAGRRERLFLF